MLQYYTCGIYNVYIVQAHIGTMPMLRTGGGLKVCTHRFLFHAHTLIVQHVHFLSLAPISPSHQHTHTRTLSLSLFLSPERLGVAALNLNISFPGHHKITVRRIHI